MDDILRPTITKCLRVLLLWEANQRAISGHYFTSTGKCVVAIAACRYCTKNKTEELIAVKDACFCHPPKLQH